jgi:4-hydroxy-tetrahydrodipicolinate synthase
VIYVAAITPRGPQLEINFGAAFELIDFLSKSQPAGIVLFSALGEYPSLASEERSRLVYLAVKRSRVPILAGVGSAMLDHSLELAREARKAGAEALLLPPPFFYAYRQDEIREFYLEFASQLGGGIPVYLSQLPEPAVQITFETASELMDTGRFAGIEDSTGELAPGLPALIASDHLLVRARCAGAAVISSAGCPLPELVLALDRALGNGQREEAARLESRLEEFLKWLNGFPPPVLIKTATALRGIKTGPITMPLPAAQKDRLEEFRSWFPAWSKNR